MDSTRDKIVQATNELMEAQGCHATGLSQIIKKSGAPKGSLYYYFPGGKDDLTVEAIERAGQLMQQRLRRILAEHADPAAAVRGFALTLAGVVESGGFRTGGPLQMIALETAVTNERANLACRAAYQAVQDLVAEKLLAAGWPAAQAASLGVLVIASIDGGVLLSRTMHSGEPLRTVGEQLFAVISASRSVS
jgi:TetR/AcrR family transcriptional repressor of lmrAB and yxaGH operons